MRRAAVGITDARSGRLVLNGNSKVELVNVHTGADYTEGPGGVW